MSAEAPADETAAPTGRKRVFLHIGAHKTGSTSIQWALYFSRQQLAARGVLYPETGCPEWSKFGQHMLAWSVIERATHLPLTLQHEGPFDEDRRGALWSALRAEIDASDAHTVVLSSEEFDVLTAREIALVARELGDYEVTPVAFLRNFADVLESAYRTTLVNAPYVKTIEEFVADQRTRLDYAAMLADWRRLSRAGEIVAFAYDDPAVRRDAVAAFIALFDVAREHLSERGRLAQNESQPAFVGALARHLRLQGVDEVEVQRWLGNVAQARFARAASQCYTLMPPPLRAELDRRYREETGRIAADPALARAVRGDLSAAGPVAAAAIIATPVEAVLALGRALGGDVEAPQRAAAPARPIGRFEAVSEERWRELWLRQAAHGDVAELPPMAPLERQQRLHGTSGEAAMAGALKFRRVVLDQIGAPAPGARFLDFGCGWGRHIRVFLKDFAPADITGVDIDADNVALCRELLPGVSFIQSEEGRPLPVEAGSVDLILSFSVFSHINEESAAFWLGELARVLKPGGTIVVTSWGQALFDIFARIRATGKTEYAWEANIARAFADMDEVERRYRAGEYVFGRHMTGGALDPEVYGIAVMPKQWIERRTGLRVAHWIEDKTLVPQTTFFLTK